MTFGNVNNMTVNFDGYLLNDYAYIQDIQGFGFPQTKDREISINGMDGGYYEGTNIETRVFTISVLITPTAGNSVYKNLDTLKNILAPWKGERQLILGAYPNRYIMARYSGSMNVDQIGLVQRFPISFRASDPLFYSNTETTTTAVLNATGIVNQGNWPTRKMTLQTTIPANTQHTIINNTAGKQLVVKNTTAGAVTVLIDFKNVSITSTDKLTNYNNFYVSGEFWSLQPGNNSITTQGNSTASTFKHNSAWL